MKWVTTCWLRYSRACFRDATLVEERLVGYLGAKEASKTRGDGTCTMGQRAQNTEKAYGHSLFIDSHHCAARLTSLEGTSSTMTGAY